MSEERNGWEEEKYSTQLEHQLTSLISTNNRLAARVAELEAEKSELVEALGLVTRLITEPGEHEHVAILPRGIWALMGKTYIKYANAARIEEDGK